MRFPEIIKNLFGGSKNRLARWDEYGDPVTFGDVSPENALNISALFGCIRFISESVAPMQIEAFQQEGKTKFPVPLPRWIENPNNGQTWLDLCSQIVNSLCIDGNAFLLTPRDAFGEVQGIYVLNPHDCYLVRSAEDSLIRLHTMGNYVRDTLQPGEFYHIPWMMSPGSIRGMSPLKYARKALSIADEAQSHAKSRLKNGNMPAASVEFPREMSKEAIDAWRTNWNKQHGSSDRAGRIVALYTGSKLTPLSFSAKDSQFIESRIFQVEELSRFYGVPLHALNHKHGGVTWGVGLREQQTAAVNFTLRGYVLRIQNAITHIWNYTELDKCVQLNHDHLLHGDFSSKVASLDALVNGGHITVNESRHVLGFPTMGDPSADLLRSPSAAVPRPALPVQSMEMPGLPAGSDQNVQDIEV